MINNIPEAESIDCIERCLEDYRNSIKQYIGVYDYLMGNLPNQFGKGFFNDVDIFLQDLKKLPLELSRSTFEEKANDQFDPSPIEYIELKYKDNSNCIITPSPKFNDYWLTVFNRLPGFFKKNIRAITFGCDGYSTETFVAEEKIVTHPKATSKKYSYIEKRAKNRIKFYKQLSPKRKWHVSTSSPQLLKCICNPTKKIKRILEYARENAILIHELESKRKYTALKIYKEMAKLSEPTISQNQVLCQVAIQIKDVEHLFEEALPYDKIQKIDALPEIKRLDYEEHIAKRIYGLIKGLKEFKTLKQLQRN